MNIELIERIAPELRETLIGATFRIVFQLADGRFAIAFDGDEFHLLFVSIEPGDGRVYLIRRKLRELKRLSIHPSHFAVTLEKALAASQVVALDQVGNDRIIEIRTTGKGSVQSLIIQLTGRSSNLFLLDQRRTIVASARRSKDEVQAVGMTYQVPERQRVLSPDADHLQLPDGPTLSESLDRSFQEIDERKNFESIADEARKKHRQEIAKVKGLVKNLECDLTEHGDPEKWKRFGDLLRASQNTAQRDGSVVRVPDLFDESAPLLTIKVDENDSIPEAANKYFRRYTKARNAREAIEARLQDARRQIGTLETTRREIENAIANKDEEFLRLYFGAKKKPAQKKGKVRESAVPSGIRRYVSSDGFEIYVGKKAADNDVLTSRIANSRDTWMHAADYPGSHVVIRNPNRQEIPHRTLIEAAQLAAFNSQAKKQAKAAVHYTLKKFVQKPKGAAPGLVRLASFKTVLVEPVFPNVLAKNT